MTAQNKVGPGCYFAPKSLLVVLLFGWIPLSDRIPEERVESELDDFSTESVEEDSESQFLTGTQ